MEYQYKTNPDPHQREYIDTRADDKAFAMFWEMGCAKSKPIIDNICKLYQEQKINGALIVAPNGVDLNWLNDEIPAHINTAVKKESRILRFSSKSKGAKWHKEEVKWHRNHTGLAWLLMSYDAFMTDEGKEAALLFLEQRECFYVLDESSAIKSPGAKRTMRITRTAYRAKYRRILDGSPVTKGAFDLYAPIQFLDETFWKRHGWDNFGMFKSYFGVFESATVRTKSGGINEFEKLIGYRNLDELNRLIKPISSRLLKKDVLTLPPKIYLPRYFELAPKQRQLYDEMENEFRIWLDQDTLVTANLAMVRMLRLQQISCGYIPTAAQNNETHGINDNEPVHMIEGKNPRLELMQDIIEENADLPAIIWARYKLDIKLLTETLNKMGKKFADYTGDTSDEDRENAKHDFQNGSIQYFVGTPSAAGRGLTLHAAYTSIYYSNSFNLMHRVQSEDRVHRRGLNHSATYTDLLGENTQDKNIMHNLCGKMDTSDAILGDDSTKSIDIRSQLKKWLNA